VIMKGLSADAHEHRGDAWKILLGVESFSAQQYIDLVEAGPSSDDALIR
jgi:hypothetical protein